jgi:hypothetical protein
MKNIKVLMQILGIALLPFFIFGCELEQGCTDPNSLDYDAIAEEDDGSCTYSKGVFYARFLAFNGIPVEKIEVSIDGEFSGIVQGNWPNGPGNCSAQNTVHYQFTSGRTIDWNSKIFLANGNVLAQSGTAKPSRISECIKIAVD